VETVFIIEAFDIFDNLLSGLPACDEGHTVEPFVLQCAEEGFRHRIVPAHSGAPDGLPHVQANEFLGEVIGRVIRAAVGVKPSSV
jgi:hypothetical protein